MTVQQAGKTMQGFSLVMELQEPGKLPELMYRIGSVQAGISKALQALDYVHSARFLPIFEQGLLLIVTEFDGDMSDYVLDFAVVLDQEFSLILSYMRDCPQLPVSKYPQAFLHYVDARTKPSQAMQQAMGGHMPAFPGVFSPYEQQSVLEIVAPGRRKALPPPPEPPVAAIDADDVQANLLQGYGARRALHLCLRAADSASARVFLAALLAHPTLHPTPQSARGATSCVTLGWTYEGLELLALPPGALARFPDAFREGAAARAEKLGDTDAAAPAHWRIGGPGAQVHCMLSLYDKQISRDDGERALTAQFAALQQLMRDHGVQCVNVERAESLDPPAAAEAHHTVHFGYRDGLSQPRIRGIHGAQDMVGLGPPGDFLLGEQFMNSRGGYHIGALDPVVASHGSYAVFRVVRQDTHGFERWLDDTARQQGLHKELIAAKLMGRWRNGTPLAQSPHSDAAPQTDLNDFDYLQRPADDAFGVRCPFGAHIRRIAPRAGMVLGVPWGRTVIRRGLPYGPPMAEQPDDEDRGLAGLFICGDIASQFEFLMKVWANGDLSAPGLRGSVDPFATSRSQPTLFRFRPGEDQPERTIAVPPLTQTVGCLYLFMPGLRALQAMAQSAPAAQPAAPQKPRDPPIAADPLWPKGFENDLHVLHAAHVQQHPLVLDEQGVYWVFGHALVKEACSPSRAADFRKRPVGTTAAQGLFFMDPPRHDVVRPLMERMLASAMSGVEGHAQKIAQVLLEHARSSGAKQLDVVRDFAQQLPMQVFMDLLGVGDDAQVLSGHFRTLLTTRQAPDDSTEAAEQAVKVLLAQALHRQPQQTSTGAPSLLQGLQAALDGGHMQLEEVAHTAEHFSLGGYMSTEFLISSGMYHLARNPQAWQMLRRYGPALVDQAVHEMLRFDAPFQVAARHVRDQSTRLGPYILEANKPLILVYGAANHDPAVFRQPERFDITRPITAEGFGFGDGIHRCIGAALGARVARVALLELLEVLPEQLQVVKYGRWSGDPFFRFMDRLVLAF